MVKKLLAILTLVPSLLFAGDLPQELFMATDVGKVAITVQDCPIKNKHGFNFRAYAVEYKQGQEVTHEGCWTKDKDVVYIWFYNEPEPIVATYKDYYFKPGINI